MKLTTTNAKKIDFVFKFWFYKQYKHIYIFITIFVEKYQN
jgi:hypothetical protein